MWKRWEGGGDGEEEEEGEIYCGDWGGGVEEDEGERG